MSGKHPSVRNGLMRLVRLALVVLVFLFPLQQPVHAKDDLWSFDYVWYVPEPTESIDQAANTITNLQTFLVVYGGIRIDRIVITREGLAIHAKQTNVQQQSNYVPSSGGSWIGTTYVPYYGGATVTQYVPVTSESQAYIDFKDLASVELMYFPNLNYKWGIHFAHKDPKKNVTLRTSDEALAKQFANAVTSLALPVNPHMLLNFDTFGLKFQAVDAKIAKKAKWGPGTGVLVASVHRGGPAEKAGLKGGDIIVEWEGQSIPDGELFPLAQEGMASKRSYAVNFQVWRDKTKIPLRMEIVNFPLEYEIKHFPRRLEVYYRNPTAEELARFGLPNPIGVVIKWVVQGQLAERMDIRKGDLLIEVNGQQIPNKDKFHEILQVGPVVSVKVIRDGTTLELKAPVNAAPLRPQPFGLSVRDLPASGEQPARLEVVAVTAGSPAARLDLRQGDILIEANGKPTRSTADLGAILAAGPVTTAKVERAGKVVTLGGGAVTSF